MTHNDLTALCPLPLTAVPEPVAADTRTYPPLSRHRRRLAELHYRRGLPFAVVNRKFYGYVKMFGDDLNQVAAVALCEAAQRYDPKYRVDGKRVKFVTFAWRWIWGRVSRHVYGRKEKVLEDKGIKICELNYVIDRWGDETSNLENYGLQYETVRKNLLGDFMPAVDARIDAQVYTKHLDRREMAIVFDRLFGDTLEEIGAKYGVSKERIRQLEKRACQRMGIEKLVDGNCRATVA